MKRPKLNYKKERCKSETYRDVFALPHKNNNQGWGIGGLLTANKEYINSSGFNSYWINFGGGYEFSNYKTFEYEYCIWFGLFTEHWGHFIVDNVSRLWYLENKDLSHCKILYVSKGGKEITGSYLRFLELFGIMAHNIIMVDEPIKIREIVIPEYCKTDDFYNDQFIEIFKRVSNSKLLTRSNIHEKIYFSRQRFKDARTKEIGEKAFENLFRKNGYEIIYPEQLDLDAQINIWANAKKIVCLNGTIPLNICFSGDNKPDVTVLNKTNLPHENLDDFCRIFGQNVRYIDVYSHRFIGEVHSIGKGPFIMEVTAGLIDFAKENNFLITSKDLNDNKIHKYMFFYTALIKIKTLQLVKKMLVLFKR